MNTTGTLLMALADGLIDGGVGLATNYPGFHSNELADLLPCPVTSVNERTALATAWGACLGGKRAVMTCKNVGLMDAADVFLGCHRCGVNAGLVVVVFDDIEGEHSQCLFDARNLVCAVDGLWFEPAGIADAYQVARNAAAVSEQLDVPVVIRIANRLYQRAGAWQRAALSIGPVTGFVDDPARWVVHPSTVAAQERRRASRNRRIGDWLDARFREAVWPSGPELVLACGPSSPSDLPAHLRLDAFPLGPTLAGRLRRWSDQGGRIRVREAGDPVVATRVAAACGSQRVDRLPAPMQSPNRTWHNRTDWEPLYGILRDAGCLVVGDLGGHLMDPRRTVAVCLCYGAATAVGAGLAMTEPARLVVAVTGDGAFAHAGWGPVAEAAMRGCRMLIVVLDNQGCRGTGGQTVAQIPDQNGVATCDTMEWGDVGELFPRTLETAAAQTRPWVVRIFNAPA